MRALAFALTLLTSLAQAQGDWPKREVKILIGFSAGGTTDIVTRLISAEEFGAYMRAETEKWAPLVKASGAKVD